MGLKRDTKGLVPARAEVSAPGRYSVLIGRGIVRIFDSWPAGWWPGPESHGLWRHSRDAKKKAAHDTPGGWADPIELFPPGVHYLN